MPTASTLDRGRDLFGRQAWADAYAQLSGVDLESPLDPEDLERLAISAYLIGKDAESLDLLARAHHEWLNRGASERGARCAFWLAFTLRSKGQDARGSGWLARARRLLDEGQHDCVEQGYLLLPVALQAVAERRRGDRALHVRAGREDRRSLRRGGPRGAREAREGPGADSVGRDRPGRGPARRGDGRRHGGRGVADHRRRPCTAA